MTLRDEHTLALPSLSHVDPRALCDGEDMRRVLLALPVAILLDSRL